MYTGIRDACSRSKLLTTDSYNENYRVRLDVNLKNKKLFSTIIEKSNTETRKGLVMTIGYLDKPTSMVEIEDMVKRAVNEYYENKKATEKHVHYKVNVYPSKYQDSKTKAVCTIDWDDKIRIINFSIVDDNGTLSVIYPTITYKTKEGENALWDIFTAKDDAKKEQLDKSIINTFLHPEQKEYELIFDENTIDYTASVILAYTRTIKGYAVLNMFGAYRISRFKVLVPKQPGKEPFVTTPNESITDPEGNTTYKDVIYFLDKEFEIEAKQMIYDKYIKTLEEASGENKE